jgi:hypothetical protein
MTLTSPAVATRQVVADTLTPVAAALRLRERLAFLLESVEGGVRYGRYSILGVRGRTLSYDRSEALVHGPDGENRFATPDPLEALRAVLPDAPLSQRDLPFPLASGVGYLAYEVAARWERLPLPDADPVGMPEAFFHLPEAVIVFDHLAQVARISAMDGPGVEERLDRVAELLGAPVAGELPGGEEPASRERKESSAATSGETPSTLSASRQPSFVRPPATKAWTSVATGQSTLLPTSPPRGTVVEAVTVSVTVGWPDQVLLSVHGPVARRSWYVLGPTLSSAAEVNLTVAE